MAHIEKRRVGYRVRWRDPEERQYSRKCPDRKTAEKVKRLVEQAIAEGRWWNPDRVREEPTVEGIMRAYLKEHSRVRSPSTIRRYAGNLDVVLSWMKKNLGTGAVSPHVLSKQLLAELYDDLMAHGRHGHPRQPATVKKIVEVFERVWAWAHNEDEYYEFVPPPRRLQMPDSPGSPVIAPTWAEMDACIAAAQGWVRQLAVVLRFTGLRVQQAMKLKWNDVDLDAATVRIRGELGKTRHERRGRVIPVSRHLIAELVKWDRPQEFIIPCQRMQDGPRGREGRGRDMGRAWKRAEVKEEIWKQRPHHAFRKGFKTELTRSGARWEAVEHLLGHQVGDSVTSRYLDPEFLPLREAVSLIPSFGQHLKSVESDDCPKDASL
jgi:integrase